MFPAQLLVLVDVHLTKSFSNIVNACFGNLVMGIFRTFSQYLSELIVLSMYNGYRPVSPYTVWFGVLLLTHNTLLQAKRCADSMTDTLAVPHISDAYNSIGLICASKRWKKNTVVSKLPRDHIVFIKSNILPLALLAYFSHEEFVDSFVVKVYPRYL